MEENTIDSKLDTKLFDKYKRKDFKFVAYQIVKSIFDRVFAFLLLVLLSPFFVVISLLIKLVDGGRVIYVHKRIGRYGKAISLFKFRSMQKDADKLDGLSDEEREEYFNEYKIDKDSRITKLGRFLRKTSIDELLNIVQVLTGEISFVGPRPILLGEAISKYGDDVYKLLSIKPGITSLWGCNGRSTCTYQSGERQRLELEYVDKCSLLLDIKILFRTVISVFKGIGAK